MTLPILIKENIQLEFAYHFRDSVLYQHGRKHGGTQDGVVLEEMGILHLNPQATGRE